MNRLLTTLLAAGMALTSTMASAVEHIVYIENKYMFPLTVYFQVGDTVRFQNNGSLVARVRTSSGSWLTNTINRNSSTTITMNSTGTVDLRGPYFVTGSSYFGGISYGQYSGASGMRIENGFAPNQCPDGRLSSSVCP